MKRCVNKCKYWDTIYCTEKCGIYIPNGYRLRDINYNNIHAKSLSIFDGDKEIAIGPISEVLKQISHLADRKIKGCRYYFDGFVIEI